MKSLSLVFKLTVSFLLGGIVCYLIFLYLPLLNLDPNHFIYQKLNIKKLRIIGFLPYWLVTKATNDYSKINQFTYFGLEINSDGSIVKESLPGEAEPGFRNLEVNDELVTRLQKLEKEKIKTSLLVHNSKESSISALIKNPKQNAQKLVEEVKPIMQQYGFDDLNLDIESFIEASAEAQLNYTVFVQEVRNALDSYYSLSIELPVIAFVKDNLINPKEIGKIVDEAIIMAYDFHYLKSKIAGPIAPIGGVPTIAEIDIKTILDEAVKSIPAEKIILGIPLYGYEWETISNKPRSATIPLGGSVASNSRVTEFLNECTNCELHYDGLAKQPYVIYPKLDYFSQIYYEDAYSLTQKLQLAKDYQLNGVAFWALGYEGQEMLTPLSDY